MRYILCLMLLCFAFCSQAQQKARPIYWEYISPQDILWKKRVWRQIDLREKNNAPMSNDSLIPKEYVFADLLLFGLKNGTIKAYADEDTGFKNPISVQKIDSIIQCGEGCAYPEQVGYYGIIEDWIFDKGRGQLVVRIWAIAPATNVNGNIKPLFWLYYPDIRQYLATYEMPLKIKNAYYSWDEYFESRQFSSKITKVSDPFTNTLPIESIYETNPFEDNSKGKKHKRKKHKVRNKDGVWIY